MKRTFKKLEKEGRVSIHTDPNTGRRFGVVRKGGVYEAKVVRDYLAASTATRESHDHTDIQAYEVKPSLSEEAGEKELDRAEEVLQVQDLEDTPGPTTEGGPSL